MTEGMWIAVITIAGGLMTAVATGTAAGLVRVVTLVLQQSRDTISSLKDERDYWRSEALACRERDESA